MEEVDVGRSDHQYCSIRLGGPGRTLSVERWQSVNSKYSKHFGQKHLCVHDENALDEISLANHSQFLLLSMGSLRRLAHQLIDKRVVSDLIPSWEETLAFEGHEKAEQMKQQRKEQEQLEYKVVNNLIDRFRGNLIIGDPEVYENDSPFEEEEWNEVRIGDLLFKSGGPCMRCATICTNQKTGERGPEPLLTLSAMRNGKANFGIHLYNIPDATTFLIPMDAHNSISLSYKEKVHIRTIKPESSPTDEPLLENGIATVPSGMYSAEKNKTPLEKLQDGTYAIAEPSEQPMKVMTTADKTDATTTQTAHISGRNKLKNQQLSSNSSSDSFTLSKKSSSKLANSYVSIASSQVQAIHIGDPVSAHKYQGELMASSTAMASSSIKTKIHTQGDDGQLHHRQPKDTKASGSRCEDGISSEKCNSSLSPNGGVKTPISIQTLQVSGTRDEDKMQSLAQVQSLIESID